MSEILADTGPLVAYLDRSDQHHAWAKEQFARFSEPLLTCEAVIAEALFLLRRGGIQPDALLKLVTRGLLLPVFSLAAEAESILDLMHRYRNVPMALADACLVRMAETHEQATVFTLDSDFSIYRKAHRRVIPVLCPER